MNPSPEIPIRNPALFAQPVCPICLPDLSARYIVAETLGYKASQGVTERPIKGITGLFCVLQDHLGGAVGKHHCRRIGVGRGDVGKSRGIAHP